MGPFDGGRPLAGTHFRRYRAECGEFVFRQRRDCPTRRKEKSRSRPRPAHHKISIPLPAFGTAQPPRPMGTGIPEPCASRAPASGRRSLGKRYTGETDIIRTLFKSLFLKRWPYFCVNHTVSRLLPKYTAGWEGAPSHSHRTPRAFGFHYCCAFCTLLGSADRAGSTARVQALAEAAINRRGSCRLAASLLAGH